jgi:hypothetical protein
MPFIELCAHPIGSHESCGAVATHRKYGMGRCDEHEIDLSPCTWERNVEDGYCALDHVEHARIYGPTCRNPRPA